MKLGKGRNCRGMKNGGVDSGVFVTAAFRAAHKCGSNKNQLIFKLL